MVITEKNYGQKLIDEKVISNDKLHEMGYIGCFFDEDIWEMNKLLLIFLVLSILAGCSTTYHMYYEVSDAETATMVSRIDGSLSRTKKSPTRCIQSYIDSTGHRVYLIETKIKEKNHDNIE